MVNRTISRTEFFGLLPIAGRLVRRRMPRDEAEKFADSREANKTGYERAQGEPDPDGVAKEAGMQMMRAVAEDAERRRKK